MRFAVVALLAGCTVVPPDAILPAGDTAIYIVHRGWHTDIGLPVEAVAGPLASLERDYPGVHFMLFGFGERNYYMAGEAGSADMLTALFPSKSAILMTALQATPREAFTDQQVVTLRLPRQNIDIIASQIWQDLEMAADGSAVRLSQGPYPGSTFYASTETYDAFFTCNTWTARILRNAGVPVMPQGVLFAGQLMSQLERIAARQAQPE